MYEMHRANISPETGAGGSESLEWARIYAPLAVGRLVVWRMVDIFSVSQETVYVCDDNSEVGNYQ